MTIKTLEHIHRILIRNESESLFLLQDARKRQYAAEDAGSPDAQSAKKNADALFEIHSEAFDALQDFESQDWR